MDFLDPAKKRAHTIRLFVGYILIGIAIIVATLILVLESFGYDLDRKTGAIIQNGIIFLAARPGPAEVYLNGNLHKSRTDSRLVLPAGQYDIELKREGYRPWKHTANLNGGSIERLVYPVLFPDNIVTTDARLYSQQPAMSTQSPDHRWLIVLQPGSLTSFDVFDLTAATATSTPINIPTGFMTASDQPQKLTPIEWSTNNRHVLLEHAFGDQREFIVVDREAPASSFNINKQFNVNPTQVTLRDKRFDRFYIYNATDASLQTGDVKTRALTPLLNKVLAFKPHGDDQILYVTDQAAAAGKVNVKVLAGTSSYTIRELGISDSYLLDMARFDNSWYFAIAATNEDKTYIYRNPLDSLKKQEFNPLIPFSVLTTEAPTHLSFSTNTRFIAVQTGGHFSVYDIETKRRYFYDLQVPLTPGQHATWMDGHRLTIISQNKTVVFDFDGTNQQTLAAASSFQPYFTKDFKVMYTLGQAVTTPANSALLRTALEVQ